MSEHQPRVVGVSDVSLGYSSPQIPALLRSLVKLYAPAKGILFEPDQSERPPYPQLFSDFEVRRIPSRFHPFSKPGVIEYSLQVAREINRLRPDLLFISSPNVLPVLLKLHVQPKAIIGYLLESLKFYTFMHELCRLVADKFDMLIYPEENRASIDIPIGGLGDAPIVIAYNAVNSIQTIDNVLPLEERVHRILYTGTIQRGLTFAEYFLHDSIRPLPIDLYGLIEGPDKQELRSALLTAGGNIRYRGYVNAAKLGELRKRYAFSIVMWAPMNENQLYACPNKFFEAIADGVPPITAPHPQTKLLVNRYQCGIVMKDWSFEAFREACQQALEIFGTPRYAEMVENCQRAVRAELNWEAQFAKIKRLLPERL